MPPIPLSPISHPRPTSHYLSPKYLSPNYLSPKLVLPNSPDPESGGLYRAGRASILTYKSQKNTKNLVTRHKGADAHAALLPRGSTTALI